MPARRVNIDHVNLLNTDVAVLEGVVVLWNVLHDIRKKWVLIVRNVGQSIVRVVDATNL